MIVRSPTLAEVPEITAVMNELSVALYGSGESTDDEVRAWFEAPDFDLERDAVVVEADDGRLVAYGDLGDRSREGRLIWLDPYVRPGAPEGAARELLDELERRAGARVAADGRLKAYVSDRDDTLGGALEARGFGVVQHSFRMQADLAVEPAAPVWPEGVSVRAFRPGEDDRRVYEVQEETFSEQLDHEPTSYEEWRHWNFREPFEPDLWFLAEDGAELAGICLGRGEHGGDETFGWISVLGVRRPWRRRGVGRALLLHAFRELRVRGRARVGLGVDGSNPTGAVELYEAVGMSVARRFDHWERYAS